ncbi:heparinase II/III family protein [Streptococcus halichoeri]|uniref:heparinase II/III family protein n=1 Tax=Streptococcus halichoeri TaxID=254785 RepID=UPI00135A95EE|nr:heparinase II/III family protein [Streptococcus halichoeri]
MKSSLLRNRPPFLLQFDPDYCNSYIKRHHKKAYEQRKKSADLLLSHTFIFTDNWDMEPCSKPIKLKVLDWEHSPTTDPEWAYMLNRQTYLMNLLLVGIVEKQTKYQEQALFFIRDWINQVKQLTPKSPATRTLDTGIRCLTWLKFLLYLDQFASLSLADESLILSSVRSQLTYLHAAYQPKYSLSNWGIPQTVAILLWSHYYGQEVVSPSLREFAETELQQQLNLQILDDGSQYEQSIMYHVEVYKNLLELAHLMPSKAAELTPVLLKMANYIVAMTGPDHRQIALGDSDRTDTRDILTSSAIFFASPFFKSKAYAHVDLDSILLFGRPGIERFETLKEKELTNQLAFFPSSGHVCYRNARSYLFFKSGPFGSSHSHSDQNSFCLYDQGQALIVDPGRYTYKEESLRYQLKSQECHSTCFLVGEAAKHVQSSWTYNSYPRAQLLPPVLEDKLVLLEGYVMDSNTCNPVLHQRQILCLPAGNTVVFDRVYCPGRHCLQTQFILDSEVTYQKGKINNLRVYSLQPLQVEEMLISKRYNQLTPSSKLVKRQPFTDTLTDVTLFLDQDCRVREHPILQTGSESPLKNAYGFELKGSNYHYFIALLGADIIQGDKLYHLAAYKCKGRVVVYDKVKGICHRLKN